jgi:hypothetical protein
MPAKRPRPGAPKNGRVTAKGTPAPAAPKAARPGAAPARPDRNSWNDGKHASAPPTFRQKGVRGQR